MLGAATRSKRFKMNLQLLYQFGDHYCLGLWVGIPFSCRKAYLNLGDELLYGVVTGASIDENFVGLCEELRAWLIWGGLAMVFTCCSSLQCRADDTANDCDASNSSTTDSAAVHSAFPRNLCIDTILYRKQWMLRGSGGAMRLRHRDGACSAMSELLQRQGALLNTRRRVHGRGTTHPKLQAVSLRSNSCSIRVYVRNNYTWQEVLWWEVACEGGVTDGGARLG